MIRYLLKKDIKEILFTYKSILTAIVVLISYFIIPIVKKMELPPYCLILFVQMVVSQFIYDSLISDINYGAIVFILNLRVKFIVYILSKIIVSFIQAIILLICIFNGIKNDFEYADIGWIIISLVNSALLMFLVAAFFKGGELSVTFITTVLLCFGIVILYKISNVFIKYFFCIFFFIIFFIFGNKLYNSKLLRERI